MNKYGIEKGMKGNEWLDRWIDEWIQVKERKLMDCGSEEKKEDVVRRGLVADSHSLAYLYFWEPHSPHLYKGHHPVSLTAQRWIH